MTFEFHSLYLPVSLAIGSLNGLNETTFRNFFLLQSAIVYRYGLYFIFTPIHLYLLVCMHVYYRGYGRFYIIFLFVLQFRYNISCFQYFKHFPYFIKLTSMYIKMLVEIDNLIRNYLLFMYRTGFLLGIYSFSSCFILMLFFLLLCRSVCMYVCLYICI